MRILKLAFKNIHSLKGEQSIDFTVPPLSQSGLFAITGPTGAGKSTILDIITLALFNRIPRFDSKITTSEIENLGSVMTHFTDDAYAEVEYQSGENLYRSTWKISKTRNNTFRDYDMTLANIQSSIFLDLKKSEVPAANEKIIGLNYDQFIRSILLSQGEFARFLKSDKAERTSLLEEITGSKIYRELGKAAYEKAKQKKEEINLLIQKKDSIQVLSSEQIDEKNKILYDNKKEIERLEHLHFEKSGILSLVIKKEHILIKLSETNISLDQHNQNIQNFEVKDIRLKKHKKLDVHRNEITLWQNDNKLLEQAEIEISDISEKLASHKKILQDSIEEMKNFTHQSINDDNFLSEMKKFENLINDLDAQLRVLTESGNKARSEFNLILTGDNLHSNELKKLTKTSDQILYCEEILKLLESRKKIPANDDEIKQKIADHQTQLLILEKKYFSAVNYENAKNEIDVLTNDILTEDNLVKKYSGEIEKITISIGKLLPEMEALQKQKENQYKIASLEEHRNILKDNEPCPLCGSIHHPYALEKNLLQLGVIEARLMEISGRLDSARKQHLNLSTNHSTAVAKLEGYKDRISKNKLFLTQIEKEYLGFSTIHSLSISIKSQSDKIKSDLFLLQQEIEARISYEFLIKSLALLKELSITGSQYNNILTKRKELYSGKDIDADAGRIQKKYISSRDLVNEKLAELKHKNENHSKLLLTKESREIMLIPFLENLGYTRINDAKKDILDDNELQDLLSEKERNVKLEIELKNNLSNLNSELSTILVPEIPENNLESLKLVISSLENQKDALIHTNGAISNELEKNIEAKILISDALLLIEKKSADASKWYTLERLIGDATGNKYARYAQNLSLLHLIDLANLRLSKLSDRYLLVHSDIESDLTITDLYQGNIKRSVKTLSGGESFIVSLALALSLADMASQNVKLESLFIDEGFGTLDAETLETAIETLERLQSESNRTIGVISHVESLKERITTQIRVIKGTGGYAKIEVV